MNVLTKIWNWIFNSNKSDLTNKDSSSSTPFQAAIEKEGPAEEIQTISIPLDQDTLDFFRTLERLLMYPKRAQPMATHREEFDKLKAIYQEHMDQMQKTGHLSPMSLEVSKHFYDTWVHRVFDELFNPYNRINKSSATAFNELYRKLYDKPNHPSYLANYNRFRG